MIAGVHFAIMVVWITRINPEFGSTPCERRLFTIVSSVIHVFCFLNLKEGRSRYRMAFYYILTLVETAMYMTVWFMWKPDHGPVWFDAAAFSVVFGAFAFGRSFASLVCLVGKASIGIPINDYKQSYFFLKQTVTNSFPKGIIPVNPRLKLNK